MLLGAGLELRRAPAGGGPAEPGRPPLGRKGVRGAAVRMGLHTGDGVLGGDDHVGIDVNRAARIAGAAHGGQSDPLRRPPVAWSSHAVPTRGASVRDLGEHRLRDLNLLDRALYDLVIEGLRGRLPPTPDPWTPGQATSPPSSPRSSAGSGRPPRPGGCWDGPAAHPHPPAPARRHRQSPAWPSRSRPSCCPATATAPSSPTPPRPRLGRRATAWACEEALEG
jgi:hypothetical protein